MTRERAQDLHLRNAVVFDEPFRIAMLRAMENAVNPPLIIEHPTVVAMKRVRRKRAERLRALRLRPWWRKVWDGVVYVVTGREP